MRALAAIAFVALLVAGGAWAASRPRAPQPTELVLLGTGVDRPAEVRDAKGRLAVFNVRTVEPGRLYRASGFPVNAQWEHDGTTSAAPAAFTGPEAFDMVRSLNVHDVVTLLPDQKSFWAEQGYFKYWSDQTGFPVTVTWMPVAPEDVYGRDDASALHAAALVIRMMRARPDAAGAVLVHGDAGKDGPGVVAAAYETWRNQGRVQRDTLWNQVLARYLASNRILGDVEDEAAGSRSRCAGGSSGFVCAEWLSGLRSDLEYLADVS